MTENGQKGPEKRFLDFLGKSNCQFCLEMV